VRWTQLPRSASALQTRSRQSREARSKARKAAIGFPGQAFDLNAAWRRSGQARGPGRSRRGRASP
jgi:hypothetical protein